MAGIEREKNMEKRHSCVFARPITCPLSLGTPDINVMMVLKGRLHEMDYRVGRSVR